MRCTRSYLGNRLLNSEVQRLVDRVACWSLPGERQETTNATVALPRKLTSAAIPGPGVQSGLQE